jgi:anti-anti-sigma factor
MATEPLIVTSTQDGTNVVIELAGAFDVSSVAKFTTAVDEVLAVRRPTVVEIDASALSFADASAMDALVRAQQHAARHGTKLHITRASDALERLLALTGLHRVLCRDRR